MSRGSATPTPTPTPALTPLTAQIVDSVSVDNPIVAVAVGEYSASGKSVINPVVKLFVTATGTRRLGVLTPDYNADDYTGHVYLSNELGEVTVTESSYDDDFIEAICGTIVHKYTDILSQVLPDAFINNPDTPTVAYILTA